MKLIKGWHVTLETKRGEIFSKIFPEKSMAEEFISEKTEEGYIQTGWRGWAFKSLEPVVYESDKGGGD